MCKKKNPCLGCGKRCVTSEYNCHSDCPDYKEYRDEMDERNETIRKKKAEEMLIIDTRVKAMRKTAKEKEKQYAWKGA